MDSNTHSAGQPARPAAQSPDGLASLATAVEGLGAQDLSGLTDAVRAERVLELRRLLDRLEGQWLAELAGVDARGAGGAEHDLQAPSTAGWLRARLRMAAGAAHHSVRTARALFRGPLTATAQALVEGELSAAHAGVLAAGTQDLPAHVTAEAEPVLVAAARRLDPPRLRRAVAQLREVIDPDTAAAQAERHHGRRGLWLTATLDGMVGVDGLLEPEAGQSLLAALEPWPARPTLGCAQWGSASGRCPGRAGPPGPGGRAVAPDRWGAPAAGGAGRPGPPPGPPRSWGCGGEVGWAGRGVGGWPATGR
jgi:hypothetical protein